MEAKLTDHPHEKMLLTIKIDWQGDGNGAVTVVREQVFCPDLKALMVELVAPGYSYNRAVGAINEAFLNGLRDVDRQLVAG